MDVLAENVKKVVDGIQVDSVLNSVIELDPAIQSWSEEVLNTLSHFIGLILCIPAVFFLITVARMRGTRWHVISCSIYGLSLMTMYFCSSLYHSVGVFINLEAYRDIFKNLDHCAIYMLIAGTYTPLTLINLIHNHIKPIHNYTNQQQTNNNQQQHNIKDNNNNTTTPQPNHSKIIKLGWILFGIVWVMCAIGVLSKMILGTDSIPDVFSNGFYLAMGWVSLLGLRDMIRVLPRTGLKLLVAGGLAYTSGVMFLVWETAPFNHAVWHLFVGAGSILHYFCILECIIPSRKDGPSSVIIDNLEWAEKQLQLAFFGSGKRRIFIINYMNYLYRYLIGWAFKSAHIQ
ncbi:Hemolysin III [Cavenderia fasciculata]|uniref:Hemolysin III n=1 Tax=Cavenderia fasciculata TaxID=261658 RepID=F4Q0V1_CACFS|nr:Hemolysin III [Cavenderia fasciculata]EGG18452.1 Hemolysin III [Cavenderia fasciculata]|eukprot:XP_004366356.1 Hemolysin III [Cavenderia fasciculata]